MKRPAGEARKEAADILSEKLDNSHYVDAGDAYSMLTVDPCSLGVESDGIRIFLSRATTRFSLGGVRHATTAAIGYQIYGPDDLEKLQTGGEGFFGQLTRPFRKDE